MSKRFQRNRAIIRKLHKVNEKERKKMIGKLSGDTLNAICDCAKNITNGNVPLTTKQFSKLKPFHKQIKALTRKSTVKNKKKILQTGGFLGFLLKPLFKILLGGD